MHEIKWLTKWSEATYKYKLHLRPRSRRGVFILVIFIAIVPIVCNKRRHLLWFCRTAIKLLNIIIGQNYRHIASRMSFCCSFLNAKVDLKTIVECEEMLNFTKTVITLQVSLLILSFWRSVQKLLSDQLTEIDVTGTEIWNSKGLLEL
jgi:hypothetical protein